MHTDVLIVGSGIAGLSCGLQLIQADPSINITILDKSPDQESNTRYAQGGIAAVLKEDPDSFDDHVKDTLQAGRGFCNPDVVAQVVHKASDCVVDLLRWGVELDTDTSGDLSLGLEGGHTWPRIVHHKDMTGLEIQKKLLRQISQQPHIKLLRGVFCLDLITVEADGGGGEQECKGAWMIDLEAQEKIPLWAKVTILATGGSGQVFERTTNPSVATGDGIAMASRAGVGIKDMHFYQIHPTAFFNGRKEKAFLITEALRGAGAYIRNHSHERFLLEGDPRGELATRDIVTALIHQEMKSSGNPFVFLDARHIDPKKLESEFPGVVCYCTSQGYNLSTDLIPVAPAAHYQCGGIKVDKNGQTNTARLFALGECAHTGLHGANRLASNSLLEALVFAKEAAHAIGKIVPDIFLIEEGRKKEKVICSISQQNLEKIQRIEDDLKSLMTYLVFTGINQPEIFHQSIEKINHWKSTVHGSLEEGYTSPALLELRNLLEVAGVMLDQIVEFNQYVNNY